MKSLAATDVSPAIAAQLARISPRERRLLAVLAMAALVVAPLKAFDMAQQARDRNFTAQADLEKQRRAIHSVQAGGVGGQTARQRQEIKAWSWPASTAPVGRALAQDRIGSIAAAAGLTGAEVKAGEKIDHAGGVDLVRVNLEAPFTWGGLARLLTGLAETRKGFMVESLTIDDALAPKLRMVFKLPVALEQPTAGPVAAEPAA